MPCMRRRAREQKGAQLLNRQTTIWADHRRGWGPKLHLARARHGTITAFRLTAEQRQRVPLGALLGPGEQRHQLPWESG